MLNIRFGFGTWKEMVELRRKIRKEREETLYKQQERRKAFFEVLSVLFILFGGIAIVGGILFSVGLGAGWW
jgi:hypothetical protein